MHDLISIADRLDHLDVLRELNSAHYEEDHRSSLESMELISLGGV